MLHAAVGSKRTDQEMREDSGLRAISTVNDEDFVVVDLKNSSKDDSKSSGELQDEEKLQPMFRRRFVKTMMGGWRSQPLMKLRKTSSVVMLNEETGKGYSSDENLEMDTEDRPQAAESSPVLSQPTRTQSGECVHI